MGPAAGFDAQPFGLGLELMLVIRACWGVFATCEDFWPDHTRLGSEYRLKNTYIYQISFLSCLSNAHLWIQLRGCILLWVLLRQALLGGNDSGAPLCNTPPSPTPPYVMWLSYPH